MSDHIGSFRVKPWARTYEKIANTYGVCVCVLMCVSIQAWKNRILVVGRFSLYSVFRSKSGNFMEGLEILYGDDCCQRDVKNLFCGHRPNTNTR